MVECCYALHSLNGSLRGCGIRIGRCSVENLKVGLQGLDFLVVGFDPIKKFAKNIPGERFETTLVTPGMFFNRLGAAGFSKEVGNLILGFPRVVGELEE